MRILPPGDPAKSPAPERTEAKLAGVWGGSGVTGSGEFPAVRLRLATGDDIRRWSSGEVTEPKTVNYHTQKPEMGGLFCENIFGPTHWSSTHTPPSTGSRCATPPLPPPGS